MNINYNLPNYFHPSDGRTLKKPKKLAGGGKKDNPITLPAANVVGISPRQQAYNDSLYSYYSGKANWEKGKEDFGVGQGSSYPDSYDALYPRFTRKPLPNDRYSQYITPYASSYGNVKPVGVVDSDVTDIAIYKKPVYNPSKNNITPIPSIGQQPLSQQSINPKQVGNTYTTDYPGRTGVKVVHDKTTGRPMFIQDAKGNRVVYDASTNWQEPSFKREKGGFLGTTNKGFNYNGAWGGQFQRGGKVEEFIPYSVHHPDFTDKYNMPIPKERQEEYQKWLETMSKKQGRDITRDKRDYDIQGYFLSGQTPDERGHSTDFYKKPNHPTFSDESFYSNPFLREQGGHWGDNSFTMGPSNKLYWYPDALQYYMNRSEPGVNLKINYKKGGNISRSKAKEMLRDGTVHGKKLTPAQKGLFGWIAGGRKPRKHLKGGIVINKPTRYV